MSAITSPDLPNFTTQWATRDGATLTIRTIRPSDYAIERTFPDGLSLATSYKRLLSGRKPTDAEVDRWTHANRVDEFALVAIDLTRGVKTRSLVSRDTSVR
jgi:hypothetical protein